jgi:hypothetical protein
VYANFTQPRGIALIINNYAFRYRSHREGTHADVENLNNLLRQLSYRVMVHNDLTAEVDLFIIQQCIDNNCLLLLPANPSRNPCLLPNAGAPRDGQRDGGKMSIIRNK